MTKLARGFAALLCLTLSGCMTCEFEQTHIFMKKNHFSEICYIVHSPEEAAGHYCLHRVEE